MLLQSFIQFHVFALEKLRQAIAGDEFALHAALVNGHCANDAA